MGKFFVIGVLVLGMAVSACAQYAPPGVGLAGQSGNALAEKPALRKSIGITAYTRIRWTPAGGKAKTINPVTRVLAVDGEQVSMTSRTIDFGISQKGNAPAFEMSLNLVPTFTSETDQSMVSVVGSGRLSWLPGGVTLARSFSWGAALKVGVPQVVTTDSIETPIGRFEVELTMLAETPGYCGGDITVRHSGPTGGQWVSRSAYQPKNAAEPTKPVNVRLDLTSTLHQGNKRPKVYHSFISVTGAVRQTLNNESTMLVSHAVKVPATAGSGGKSQDYTAYETADPISVSIIPSLVDVAGAGQLVSVVGDVRFRFPRNETMFAEKSLPVSVSLEPGKSVEVASGSEYLPDGSVEYVLTVTAEPLEGLVMPQAQSFGGPMSSGGGSWGGGSRGF